MVTQPLVDTLDVLVQVGPHARLVLALRAGQVPDLVVHGLDVSLEDVIGGVLVPALVAARRRFSRFRVFVSCLLLYGCGEGDERLLLLDDRWRGGGDLEYQ